jgi:hypothetical protein
LRQLPASSQLLQWLRQVCAPPDVLITTHIRTLNTCNLQPSALSQTQLPTNTLAMAFAMQTSLCRPTTNFRVARPATRAPRARVVVRAEVWPCTMRCLFARSTWSHDRCGPEVVKSLMVNAVIKLALASAPGSLHLTSISRILRRLLPCNTLVIGMCIGRCPAASLQLLT